MDMFLRIDAIPGDSTLKGHEKWIPVATADWGVSQALVAQHGGGAGGRGRAEFRPAAFTAWTGTASPLLFEACATGRHAATATFEALRSGATPTVAVRWEFEEILVMSFSMAGTEGASAMTDAFALDYKRFRVTTFEQSPRGGSAPVARGWDLAASRPW